MKYSGIEKDEFTTKCRTQGIIVSSHETQPEQFFFQIKMSKFTPNMYHFY